MDFDHEVAIVAGAFSSISLPSDDPSDPPPSLQLSEKYIIRKLSPNDLLVLRRTFQEVVTGVYLDKNCDENDEATTNIVIMLLAITCDAELRNPYCDPFGGVIQAMPTLSFDRFLQIVQFMQWKECLVKILSCMTRSQVTPYIDKCIGCNFGMNVIPSELKIAVFEYLLLTQNSFVLDNDDLVDVGNLQKLIDTFPCDESCSDVRLYVMYSNIKKLVQEGYLTLESPASIDIQVMRRVQEAVSGCIVEAPVCRSQLQLSTFKPNSHCCFDQFLKVQLTVDESDLFCKTRFLVNQESSEQKYSYELISKIVSDSMKKLLDEQYKKEFDDLNENDKMMEAMARVRYSTRDSGASLLFLVERQYCNVNSVLDCFRQSPDLFDVDRIKEILQIVADSRIGQNFKEFLLSIISSLDDENSSEVLQYLANSFSMPSILSPFNLADQIILYFNQLASLLHDEEVKLLKMIKGLRRLCACHVVLVASEVIERAISNQQQALLLAKLCCSTPILLEFCENGSHIPFFWQKLALKEVLSDKQLLSTSCFLGTLLKGRPDDALILLRLLVPRLELQNVPDLLAVALSSPDHSSWLPDADLTLLVARLALQLDASLDYNFLPGCCLQRDKILKILGSLQRYPVASMLADTRLQGWLQHISGKLHWTSLCILRSYLKSIPLLPESLRGISSKQFCSLPQGQYECETLSLLLYAACSANQLDCPSIVDDGQRLLESLCAVLPVLGNEEWTRVGKFLVTCCRQTWANDQVSILQLTHLMVKAVVASSGQPEIPMELVQLRVADLLKLQIKEFMVDVEAPLFYKRLFQCLEQVLGLPVLLSDCFNSLVLFVIEKYCSNDKHLLQNMTSRWTERWQKKQDDKFFKATIEQ